MDDGRCDVLVLGVGNLLVADDGFGVRAVEALERAFAFPDGVRLMDGGTQGLYLVNEVRDARRVLAFDAVDYGLAPGAVRVLRGDEVPRFGGAGKLDAHQAGFQDVLFAAAMLGGRTEDVVLVGVQPAVLEDMVMTLSEPVRSALPRALEAGLAVLAEWGVEATPRDAPDPAVPGALPAGA